MDAKGVEVDAITYNTLMQAHASKGDVRGAEKVLERRRDRGVEVEANTKNPLMPHASKGDAWCGEGARADDGREGYRSDAITYNTLMQAYASRGDVAAVSMLRENARSQSETELSALFSLHALLLQSKDDDAFGPVFENSRGILTR